MSTFDDMVERVILELSGYTEDQESTAVLPGVVTDSATTITLTDGDFSRGIIEIGDELIYAPAVNAGVVTGAIRGFRGSTAATHPAGTEVRDNPRFPRVAVIKGLNDTLQSTFPKLWQAKIAEITTDSRVGYEVPADVERVLRVEAQDVSGLKMWEPVRDWGFDNVANTTDFPSGKCIRVNAPSGRLLQVVYAGRPTALASGDDFTDSGLPLSCEDVIHYGTCARLVSMASAGQQSAIAAEAQLIDARQQTTGALQVSRYFQALFQVRLDEEANALLANHKTRAHRRI